jgi:oligopeptide/dipeptide ABC transporter ATP-binding protein
MNDTTPPLVDVAALEVYVRQGRETRQLIRNVSLTVQRGESVGLVGESGSGKSVTVRAVLRFLETDAIVNGTVEFAGEPIYDMGRERLRRWHRDDVTMIYQDPAAHINPLRTIGDFLTEALRLVHDTDRHVARRLAIDVLESVGINNAETRMAQYPHQLSGGLLQRVMIASTLVIGPQLIVADEPTTALDMTTQEEVMAILDDLRRERGLAMIFITHDLDLAAAVTDRLAVMYAGIIVETGPSSTMQGNAKHPYTAALHASRPSTVEKSAPLAIPGRPVAAWEAGEGCPFEPRCAFAADVCRHDLPALRAIDDHLVACHRAEDITDELTRERMAHL